MQMRKTYASTNKRKQANEYRRAAKECEVAGFADFAQVNWDMAAFLDPPQDEDEY